MMAAFWALLPFLLFVILFFSRKASLLGATLIALVMEVLVMLFYWRLQSSYWLLVVVKSGFTAWDIWWIVVGAIFYLQILKRLQIVETVSMYLQNIAGDYRVQVILLAWFLENFIEGTAGFGTPAALVVPMLLGLGIAPITAVVLGLLGNSASVVFGAAGTPIRVGFMGINWTSDLPLYAAIANVGGILVPVFMLWVITRGRKEPRRQFVDGLPFAVWSGLVFYLASILTVFLGQEFPSILGSVLSLLVVLVTIRKGWLMPKEREKLLADSKVKLSLKVLFPYGLLIILLLLGKIFLGSVAVNIAGVKQSLSLFNPGYIFLITGIVVAILRKLKVKIVLDDFREAIKKSIEPMVIILMMSGIVQLMLNSGFNTSGLPSYFQLLETVLVNRLLIVIAPILGVVGSFITGSATLSNVMFGHFVVEAGESMGMNIALLLALQVVGGAAGNMIAVSDVLVATTIGGVKSQESKVIGEMMVFCLLYLVITGLVGFSLSLYLK